ncbi:endonuclease/exonuclease/phosphatase family protein [Actinoplanes sichuanensis]|uniref:Endonuclease/exonuclease/phosphatase family protein n=1 Tax=Actinoplanes sichuanensis TaxID=512349 RepID=A0ABW4A6T0_9ACTN|nr:endonuclease/exonuclease/phosphatase family protein [Actinoplanes sichuanensis]BEL03383.1 endonuclease/exonuclease/phosphatase family protein [Actinoplanes sichuanensis]
MNDDAATRHTIRVMTWNLWWRFGPDRAARQAGIRAVLTESRPDVLALQETWPGQADELADTLGMHAVFAGPSYPAAPADQEFELGIAVLTRWPILDSAARVLPARHRRWDPVALTVRTAHPAGPLPVVAACLEHAVPYTDDRVAQGAALAEMATDPSLDGPTPVLLLGDLNAAVDSPVLRPIRDVLVDAWTAGDGDPDAITLPSTHPYAPMEAGPQLIDRRIDHVFFRAGRENQQVAVDAVRLAGGEPVGGVHPSDHRAVAVDLRWHG